MVDNNQKNEVLDAASLAQIKADLLKQKEQIKKDLADLARKDSHETDNRTTAFPEYGYKPDENAQEISEYSSNVVTEKVLEDASGDIDGALKRIENGNYGICKYCQNPISIKRLQARPTASSCVACKTELQAE
ncbi:MAG: TraR/DksA C4-type zinc finger protein [Patescibacteria group bacterium]|jgi:RNA polymerase-binding transcription factor DksA